MKLSAFTMCRNATKYYYPIKESILSALPIVDEYVVVVGKGDSDDRTLALVKSINDAKVRVIESDWDIQSFPNGMIHAQQTDLAKSYCTGDWLLYLQADEVLHEHDLPKILSACTRYLSESRLEGFLFKYLHFWGDFNHVQQSHSWYNREIRIVRNNPEIHSWQSAQSFRRIPGFDGVSYRKKEGTSKLKVREIDATVHHYGWVRPPALMTAKMNELDRIHSHSNKRFSGGMNFGNLNDLPLFKGVHPSVMGEWIAAFEKLKFEYVNDFKTSITMKHQRGTEKLLTWIESRLLNGRRIMNYKNYILIK